MGEIGSKASTHRGQPKIGQVVVDKPHGLIWFIFVLLSIFNVGFELWWRVRLVNVHIVVGDKLRRGLGVSSDTPHELIAQRVTYHSVRIMKQFLRLL